MNTPEPQEMLRRMKALPGVAPVLAALAGVDGAYVVGGVPRDILLARTPLDVDVVIVGDAVAAAREAADRLSGEVVEHERFGTATVRAAALSFDLAQARTETYPGPGALPDVTPSGTIEDDLERRDFGVNAMAVALGGPQPGRLAAVDGALDDLERRRLRVLHMASFVDDPTRILRAVRYGHRLGFGVEGTTAALLGDAVAAGALGTVTGGRIGDELRLLCAEADPAPAFLALDASGVAGALHPRLTPAADAAPALELLPDDGRADLVVLAAACGAFGGEELARWLDDLEYVSGDRDVVVAAALRSARLAADLDQAQAPSGIARAVAGLGPEAVALAGARGAEEAARRWLDELRHVRLDITGDDLIAAGVPESPAIGRALTVALAARLDGDAPDRAAQLRIALAQTTA